MKLRQKNSNISKVKKCSILSRAETVGGVSGDANITAMWKNYFCSLLNSVPINSHQESAKKSAIKNGNFDNIHEFLCDPGAIRPLSFSGNYHSIVLAAMIIYLLNIFVMLMKVISFI